MKARTLDLAPLRSRLSLIFLNVCSLISSVTRETENVVAQRVRVFSSTDLIEWLGIFHAVSPTVRGAADDVAAWSAAEQRA